MKPIAWLVGGFALTGLAGAIESMGDLGPDASSRLPLYIPALLVLFAGQYCLWRGVRSGVVVIWSGAFDRRRNSPDSDSPRPAHRLADSDSADGFDPDEVLARYLKQREANSDHAPKLTSPTAPTQPVRPSFGRRSV